MPETPMREVTLAEILARRELRVAKQRALLTRFPDSPLLCVTVNRPGPVKRTPSGDRVFFAGLAALRDALDAAGIAVLHVETICPDAGCEGYVVPDADAETAKRIACDLEAALPYGRLLDIDVHAQGGGQLSRTDLALPARGCMVCGRPGRICASRRLHPLPALYEAFDRLAQTVPREDEA